MQNKGNYKIVILVFVTLIIGLVLGNFITERSLLYNNSSFSSGLLQSLKSHQKVSELLGLIEKKYVDSLDVNEFTEELSKDLIAKLDPHSVYIPLEDIQDSKDELSGSFSGIGVQFNIQNDTVMIISVISGGPSEKAGLLAGDRIIQVNDSNFTGKSVNNEKVMKSLKGPEGTKVKLGIKRNSSKKTLIYTITRGNIPVNSVDIAYMISPKVGLIKVNKFASTTYSEFLNGIGELKSKGATKMIIDLRENSGGFMEECIQMVNEFLPKNQMIVYAKGRTYPKMESLSDGTGTFIKEPIVVLIDEFSASASEIFAGAMQDNDRATIIGRRSFGKGLIQQPFPLSDGSEVRLTVARYYTPSGRSIQKPYVKGDSEDYAMDIYNRYLHGEFEHSDSISFADSLKYKTKKGRTVYGGGGIMPDIFIPRDTNLYSSYFTQLVNGLHIYQYAFEYSDKNRKKLMTYKNWKELNAFLDKEDLFTGMNNYAKSKGIKASSAAQAKTRNTVTVRLKAYIARNILGDAGFFPILLKDDPAVLKALEVLK